MYAKVPDLFPDLRGGGVFLRAMDETDLPAWVIAQRAMTGEQARAVAPRR